MLKDKVAVIYCAGVAIGEGDAAAFDREGAYVHLTRFHLEAGNRVAEAIQHVGGLHYTAVLDALDSA